MKTKVKLPALFLMLAMVVSLIMPNGIVKAEDGNATSEEIPTVDVSLNTQFMDKDRNFSKIPNAVSKAVNTETGEEFIFKMDAEGNIPHLQLPAGTYELSLVSVPEEFAEGKRLDTSFTDTVTIKENDRAKGWKVTVKEIPTIDVSLNTQFMDKDRNFSKIPNAVSKAVNTETGEEFIFKMDAEGNIPHLQLPAGTYELSLVSVPEEFAESKNLDLSATSTEVVLETDKAHGWTLTVKELPTDEETPAPETKMWQFGARLSFRNLPGNVYESLEKVDTPWKSVIGAEIKIINTETGKVYTFTTNESGSHQLVETGKYTMELVSVPEELKGKFEWPEAKEIEINGPSFNGFNVEEIKDETPEKPKKPEKPGEDTKPSETTKPSESKKDDSDLTKTGQSENLLFVGLASLVVAGYLVVKRREDLN